MDKEKRKLSEFRSGPLVKRFLGTTRDDGPSDTLNEVRRDIAENHKGKSIRSQPMLARIWKHQAKVNAETWNTALSTNLDAKKSFNMSAHLESLYGTLFSESEKDLEASYEENVKTQLDLRVLRILLHGGILSKLFLLEDVSLAWIVEDPPSAVEAKAKASAWVHDCVNNRVELFLATYSLWFLLAKLDFENPIVVNLAGHIAYVGVSLGFYYEAIAVTDYMIKLSETQSEKPATVEALEARGSWLISRGIAFGCLGEIAGLQESLARAMALEIPEGDVEPEHYGVVKGNLKFSCLREELRFEARRLLRASWGKWPRKVDSDWTEKLNEFEALLKGRNHPFPIDYDTAGRCILLFDGEPNKERWKEANRLLRKGKRVYKSCIAKGIHARYANLYELDCLQTTEILLRCASGDRKRARRLYDEYRERTKLEIRRHTRRVSTVLTKMVESVEKGENPFN